MLHRYRAEATIAVDRTTKGRLEAFQRVLEFDPRDLRSRLEVVDALVELGRADEAMQMVTALRTELPGSSRVAKAWTFLATPWRMPEPGDVRQRIARPWENGHDERAEIIGILIDEVVEKLTLQPAVADRIRHQVSVDNAVYRPAVDEEHAYLDARDDYHRTVRQKHRHRIARSYSYALFSLSALVCGAGIATLIQQGLALVTIAWWPPVTWVIVASLAVFLFLWIMGRVDDKTFQRGAVAAAAFSTAGWAWGLLRFEDIRVGAPLPIVVTAITVGVFRSGTRIRRDYAPPSDEQAQRAFDVWLESLYGNGLLPIATEASSLGTTYRTSLPPHCRIVTDTAIELDTPATRELRRLLRQRNKGSFALAGPRGAGKSTLLGRWCAGHFLREDNDPRTTRHDLIVTVDAPVGYKSQEFLHHLFGQVCDAVERYALEHKQRGPRRSMWFRLRRKRLDELGRPRPGQTVTAAHLELLALRERENIRHVQSRTTEGEWSVGMPPLGGTLGAKAKVSVQRSDVPFNHPELVARFRDFLRTAADVAAVNKGKVLVGIDELDRISDGMEAQRFINELKAVFNVPNCYFLVSVSEDALADFELSAMGMRTVFDSAFDSIVRVDYLDFPQARTLLNRRIIDLPEQFTALAYVLSGGLARELTRVAEEIADERSEARGLDAMAVYLVRRQLGRTARAAMDRLSRIA
ncbi:hypothetical protein ACFQ1S_11145, partial [Kibdelosporangium lantanae]